MQKTIDKQDEICYNDKVVRKNAGMAQSVEHVIGNDGVASPILANGTIYDKHLLRCFFCWYN